MPSDVPCQIVLQCPAVLSESNNLATFARAKRVIQAARRLVVDINIRRRLFGGVSLNLRVVEPVMREIYFVGYARAKGVRFN